MVCSIIGDMAINKRILRRLKNAVVDLIAIYNQCIFLVGDMTEFERAALAVVKRVCREYYFAGYNVVTCEETDAINTLTPDGIWMVKDEYVGLWRNTWMLKQSSHAIVCMEDISSLPVLRNKALMEIIDIAEK